MIEASDSHRPVFWRRSIFLALLIAPLVVPLVYLLASLIQTPNRTTLIGPAIVAILSYSATIVVGLPFWAVAANYNYTGWATSVCAGTLAGLLVAFLIAQLTPHEAISPILLTGMVAGAATAFVFNAIATRV